MVHKKLKQNILAVTHVALIVMLLGAFVYVQALPADATYSSIESSL